MKRISIAVCFLAGSFNTMAQLTELFFEDFDNGFPTGWLRLNEDGLVPHASVAYVNDAWVVVEAFDSTGIGDSVLVATSYYTPAGTAKDWVFLPPITLENNGNFLEWQVKSQDPSYPDGYQVLINTSAAVKDSFNILTPLFSTDAELPTWTTRSVTLDSFAGQTVYIAFRLKTTDKFLLLLDDIHVYADTLLSITENTGQIKLGNVFPNPAENYFNVEYYFAGHATYVLRDMSGREVLRIPLYQGINRVERNHVQAGVYIGSIISEKGVQSIPVILR
ncbi:MAG: choice-of-anchor J domain-containing protein [Flavobacteriales bacterium]